MIGQAESIDFLDFPASVASSCAPSAGPPGAGDDCTARAVQQAQHAPQTIEGEIARLTWSVLDGGATLADRRRLAELVNAQHSQRRQYKSK